MLHYQKFAKARSFITIFSRFYRLEWARIMRYWSLTHRVKFATLVVAAKGSKSATSQSAEAFVKHLATSRDVLILNKNPPEIRIGVQDTDFAFVISQLKILRTNLTLKVKLQSGVLKKFSCVLPFASSLRKAVEVIAEWQFGNSIQRLVIEIYWSLTDSYRLSSNPDNVDLRARYSPFARGCETVEQALGGRPLSHFENPIDCVITWVNHADPKWSSMHAAFKPKSLVTDRDAGDGDALSRYYSFDELRYCLRSINANMPWLRSIFVFTNCSRPDWLCPDHSGIRWIDHCEVINPVWLPLFNSHAIETFLHEIPDLSDYFLYLNDDFFVLRPTSPETFLLQNGVTKFFPERAGTVSGRARPNDPAYLSASRNSAQALVARGEVYPTRLMRHAPYVLNRNVLSEMCEYDFRAEIKQTRSSKFRDYRDVNLVSFLYHYHAFNRRLSAPYDIAASYIGVQDPFWRTRLNDLASGNHTVVCLNNGGLGGVDTAFERSATAFLRAAFPCPAPWER